MAGVALSALLIALYARGGWALGFVALVPWLVAVDRLRSVRGALVAGVAMSVGFVAAAFGWFGPAVADFTALHPAAATAMLLVAAPFLQPQLVAYALVRRLAARRHGGAVRVVLASAAWVVAEWAVPRVFGDTLGHGLQPSKLLRQGADLTGAVGLTVALLIANEAFAAAVSRAGRPLRCVARPLALAAAMPLLLAGYGAFRLNALQVDTPPTPFRIGLVQAAIVDYERLRREEGAYNVVRRVLDTHYALSTNLRAQGAEAIVWAETVYPTTYGQARSVAAAELDRELGAFVARIGIPLVFGTYTRDAEGEYNAAAFVDPARGLIGTYRKTRLFPLTEYVPPPIDGPALRRLLPWAGTWRPGDGARVFPLFTADGREIPVAPLICRDDVDAGLARDAALLGAQVLVGLSNDAWFSRAPLGARLHLAAASFRSIETRLPQVRATTNGMSAGIDATGEVSASTAMGQRTTLLAGVHPGGATTTLFVRWGNWLLPLSMLALVGVPLLPLFARRPAAATTEGAAAGRLQGTRPVLLVRDWQRWLIGGLRLVSRGAVLVLGVVALVADEAPRVLTQLHAFATWVVLPELIAAALARGCAARMRIDDELMVLKSGRHRVEIDRRKVRVLRPWRVPWPQPGFDLVLQSGQRWTHGISLREAASVISLLTTPAQFPHRDVLQASPAADAPATTNSPEPMRTAADEAGPQPASLLPPPTPDGIGRGTLPAENQTERRSMRLLEALEVEPWRIDRPLLKFVLFPLLPALPAFRLHQVIAYGSAFGEYHTFGAMAYVRGLLLWWGSWAVALVLLAGGMRLFVESVSWLMLALRPGDVAPVRRALLGLARVAYFVGVPLWLLARLLIA